MTKEQIEERNRQIKEYEEMLLKLRYIQDGRFITLDVYKNFLMEHGYILTGYDSRINVDWNTAHINFHKLKKDSSYILNRTLVLVGNQSDWGDYMNGFCCKNIVNPFVKYIETDFTTFKIYTIIKNENNNEMWFEFYNEDYCPKLEKDLSKEWIRYLVKICPEFGEYQIQECKQNKINAQKNLEYKQTFIAKRIAELYEDERRLLIERDENFRNNDEIISIIKKALEENVQYNK